MSILLAGAIKDNFWLVIRYRNSIFKQLSIVKYLQSSTNILEKSFIVKILKMEWRNTNKCITSFLILPPFYHIRFSMYLLYKKEKILTLVHSCFLFRPFEMFHHSGNRFQIETDNYLVSISVIQKGNFRGNIYIFWIS